MSVTVTRGAAARAEELLRGVCCGRPLSLSSSIRKAERDTRARDCNALFASALNVS